MTQRYQTSNIPEFYKQHRISWDEIYPSEKNVIARLNFDATTRVLDMGCACGGLGLALKEKFGVTAYTGVDINQASIHEARSLCSWGDFHSGDFLEVESGLSHDYDVAFSLSCADWDVQTEKLLTALFKHVRSGGSLVFSSRLTNEPLSAGCLEGRQAIEFSATGENGALEYAPYKVYRLEAMLKLLGSLGDVSEIYGYGYWGQVPSSVCDLSVDRVFYTVFGVRKAADGMPKSDPRVVLDVSAELFASTR